MNYLIYIAFSILYILIIKYFDISITPTIALIIVFTLASLYVNGWFSYRQIPADVKEEKESITFTERSASTLSAIALAIAIFIAAVIPKNKHTKEMVEFIITSFVFSVITLMMWWVPTSPINLRRVRDIKTCLLTISISFLIIGILSVVPNLKVNDINYDTKYAGLMNVIV